MMRATKLVVLSLVGLTTAANPAGLYDLFVRYAKYSAAAYASDCPKPPYGATAVQYFSGPVTDTQATLFRDDKGKELVIAFRGTSDLADFGTDGNDHLVPLTAVGASNSCSACRVHNGTLLGWNEISRTVISSIRAQQATHPGYSLTLTGHSLGAALSSIASTSFHGLGFDFHIFNFGQFRTGNPAYANYIDKIIPPPRFHRVTHTNDGVPQAIPTTLGYRHHSTEYWELEPFGPGETQQCSGQEPPDCNNSQAGLGLGDTGTPFGINPAHLCYSGILIGNPVDGGRSACGALSPLPQNCSTATGGGIV